MKMTSSVFGENADIPAQFTCDGSDRSPPLYWAESPPATKTFALIVDDPDAPSGNFVHWLLYNVPGSICLLEENQPHAGTLENGARQGINDFRKIGYAGPCPPRGTHRYFFKLYALDNVLPLNPGATKEELLQAMEGHVMAESQFVGRYSRADLGQEKSKKEKDQIIDKASEESFPASDAPPHP